MPDDETNQITKPLDTPPADAPPTTKSKRGGYRPGGGRPKGAKDKQQRLSPKLKASFAEAYKTKVEENAERLIDAAINAGTRGDSRMLLDMISRFVGPARSSLELSGPNGAPLQLQAMAAAALVGLSDAQLDALESFHAALQPASSGDRALPLPPLSPLSGELASPAGRAPFPTPPDVPSWDNVSPDSRSPMSRLTSVDTPADEEKGGSPASPPTTSPGTLGSGAQGAEQGQIGGESGSSGQNPGDMGVHAHDASD